MLFREKILTNFLKPNNSTIILGKKRRHVLELLFALALQGSCTTRESSRFILSEGNPKRPVNGTDAKTLEMIFYNLLHGRKKGKNMKRNYPGLIQSGYVINTGKKINQKGKEVSTYFLSLKGCLFVLGFSFNLKETLQFIENASKYHIFFSYVFTLTKKIRPDFPVSLFIEPIRNLIKSDKLFLDNEYHLQFSLIAEIVSIQLKKIFKSFEEIDGTSFMGEYYVNFNSRNAHKKISHLLKNLWNDNKDNDRWFARMIDLYVKDEDVYLKYSHAKHDPLFLLKIMQSIRNAYYELFYEFIPTNLDYDTRYLKVTKFKPDNLIFPSGKLFVRASSLHKKYI